MKNYLNLNELQLDALKEISNIGVGNAATSLSMLIGREVKLTVPKATLAPFSKIVEIIGGAEKEVAGGYLYVNGDIPLGILFFIPREQIPRLLDLLYGETMIKVDNNNHGDLLNEIQVSALKEIVNILAGSYLNSLGIVTNQVFVPSVPALSVDMAGAILGQVLQSIGNVSDYALIIENVFSAEGEQINGYFFLIPEPETLDSLLKSIGV